MIRRRTFASFALGMGLAFSACSSDEARDPGIAEPAPDAAPSMRATGLPATCARGAKAPARTTECNGAAELCDRAYDRVVVPMTHNAMSNADEGWAIPNQTHGLARQLGDGIRGMMLDVHYYDPETRQNDGTPVLDLEIVDQLYLCHTGCILGQARLLDGLCTVTRFLDDNPGEVLTIIFENHVSEEHLAAVLEASGLSEYAYAHPSAAAPWPTLRAMIDEGRRAVLFVERGGGSPDYLHPAFDGLIRDTAYTFERKEQFACALNRGTAESPLFLVNHWLGRPSAGIALAAEVNGADVLGKRVTDCTKEVGRPPTFVGVDFYEVGDLFRVVAEANGVAR